LSITSCFGATMSKYTIRFDSRVRAAEGTRRPV